ncbi:TetR/AcrR family transcriptional regulator [Streptomyces sp. NPDC088246]|uniref:TetR/AcrR family transcriptional regulator n=1 Tax=Streptomyces sp. NPDC088246 TaxID=3365842 RepID=UPI0037FF1D91
MPKGPTKRRPQTTARLLEAAQETFTERGFHGSSFEVICERAGLTCGALYSNFRAREKLFFALFDLHAHFGRRIETWTDRPRPAPAPTQRAPGLTPCQ